MVKPFYDLSDSYLLIWFNSFSQHLTATPAVFQVELEMAAACAAGHGGRSMRDSQATSMSRIARVGEVFHVLVIKAVPALQA